MAKRYYSTNEVILQAIPKTKRFKDLTNKTFGRLKVLGLAGKSNCGHSIWFCTCICGKIIKRQSNLLSRSKTPSCGCYSVEETIKRNLEHGLSGSEHYKAWKSIKDRCYNPNSKSYKDYGARGITMAKEWLTNYKCFYNYIVKNLGAKPKSFSLDRIDNSKGYEPGNLRWASRVQQNRNRRNTKFITYKDKTMTIKEWADFLGVKYDTLHDATSKGKSIDFFI